MEFEISLIDFAQRNTQAVAIPSFASPQPGLDSEAQITETLKAN